MKNLSDASVKDFQACRRLYHYRWRLGRVPLVDAEPLRFGRVWHAGLAGYWTARKDDKDPLDAAVEAIRSTDEVEWMLVKATVMAAAYATRWHDDGLRVLAVDERFEGPLVNPDTSQRSRSYQSVGVLDLVVEQEFGDRWRQLVVEHKSASASSDLDGDSGARFWRRLRSDAQVSTYDLGNRVLGYECEGTIYDVARKPDLRPIPETPTHKRKYRKAATREEKAWWWNDPRLLYASQRLRDETIDEFRDRCAAVYADGDLGRWFGRTTIVRLEDERREFARDQWAVAQEVREDDKRAYHPRTPKSCEQHGDLCAYYEVCWGQQSLDDPTLFRNRRSS